MSLLSRPPLWSTWCNAVIASILLATASVQVQAKESVAAPDQSSAMTETVALSKLPREAQTTHRLILAGGPFPYDKDGIVFGNRERLLPAKTRGYYREYTVPTPGARNRGARRLVCGGKPPTNPDVCYYTSDHYSSFKRIEQ